MNYKTDACALYVLSIDKRTFKTVKPFRSKTFHTSHV